MAALKHMYLTILPGTCSLRLYVQKLWSNWRISKNGWLCYSGILEEENDIEEENDTEECEILEENWFNIFWQMNS